MKKILFVLAMMFSITCVFGQTNYKFTFEEAKYLESCINNDKMPGAFYIGGRYVYNPHNNDYEKVKLSADDTAYYNGLNNTYKELNKVKRYFNEDNFTASTIYGYLNYAPEYNSIRLTNKYRKQLNGGITLIAVGTTIIVGGEMFLTHFNWDNTLLNSKEIANTSKNIKTVTWVTGGVMAITGTILTVNAINKQNHLLVVGANNMSYTYKF